MGTNGVGWNQNSGFYDASPGGYEYCPLDMTMTHSYGYYPQNLTQTHPQNMTTQTYYTQNMTTQPPQHAHNTMQPYVSHRTTSQLNPNPIHQVPYQWNWY